MGASGNPAKKPAAKKVSSAKDFKKKTQATLELPSGAVVKLRNPGGLRVFMRNGSIPNSLMPVVSESLASGKDMDMKSAADEVDNDTIVEMMEMMDTVAIACFAEPRAYAPPEDEADRDDELLYTDEIADEDKMFVFQWMSGGTTDVEQFRAQQKSNVAAMGE